MNEDTIAYGHEELAHWTEARVENCLELVLQDAYVRRQVNLKQRPMAQDLISQCLSRDPAERPTMRTVCVYSYPSSSKLMHMSLTGFSPPVSRHWKWRISAGADS